MTSPKTLVACIGISVCLLSTLLVSWELAARYEAAAWFRWHPVLMTVGLLGLVAPGLYWQKATRHHPTHRVLLLSGVALVLFAYYVIFTNKDIQGKPHLTSWHAYWGVGAAALLAFQLVAALVQMPVGPGREEARARAQLRANHILCGKVAWILAVVALWLGWEYTTGNARSPDQSACIWPVGFSGRVCLFPLDWRFATTLVAVSAPLCSERAWKAAQRMMPV